MVDETIWAITNGPATLQSLMNEAFQGILEEICLGIL